MNMNENISSTDMKCDLQVRSIQLKLNSIRNKYHYAWEELKPDGIYGPRTQKVVTEFQRLRGITPVSGVLGPTTINYILEADRPKMLSNTPSAGKNYDSIKSGISNTYNVVTQGVGSAYQINDMVNPGEKRLAFVFAEWNKILKEQYEGILRRISKLPAKKQMRARNVARQMERVQKFVVKAQKYGINTAAVEFGSELTKENAIKYIKNIANAIDVSSLTKSVRMVTNSLAKIKRIIRPVIEVLDKIPGLKYFSVIEKIVKATIKMLQSDFEGAFILYSDGLRELAEQVFIDAVVVALVAMGGWIALVIAIVVIIGALLVDYFLFSDNPGESLVDKAVGKKITKNLTTEYAGALYHVVNK